MLQQIHAEAITPKDHKNPHTKRHQIATLLNWCTLLEATFPTIPEENHWSRLGLNVRVDLTLPLCASTILNSITVFFILFQTAITPGQNQEPHMKAITLRGWQTHLIHCILKYTHDQKSQLSTGMSLLVTQSLYQELKDEVDQCVFFYFLFTQGFL